MDRAILVPKEPAEWVRGYVRFGSIERRLKGYGFDPETLLYMKVCWPVTPIEAMKVDEFCKRIGLIPKEAQMDAICTLVSQDLTVFRWDHWDFPKVHHGDVIGLEYKSLDELRTLEAACK